MHHLHTHTDLEHVADVYGGLLQFGMEERSGEIHTPQRRVAIQNGGHCYDTVRVHVCVGQS